MTDTTGTEERRHQAGPEEWWGESWYYDFVTDDGGLGGYMRLGLYPNRGVAWYWLYLVGDDLPLIRIRDHKISCPTDDNFTFEGDGWTSQLRWDDPRWLLTAEGQALALSDPLEAYRGEHGSPIQVRVALDWEGIGPIYHWGLTTRYEQTSRIRGDVTIGGEHYRVDCLGQRDHSWGVRSWDTPNCWSAGRLDDGTSYHLTDIFELGLMVGYVNLPDGNQLAITGGKGSYDWDEDLLLRSGQWSLTAGDVGMTMSIKTTHHAPVKLEAPEFGYSLFPRSTIRLNASDGRAGRGWMEFTFPGGERPALEQGNSR